MRPVDFVSLALRLSVLSHGNGGNEISHHFDWNVHQSYQSIVRVGLLFTFDWNGRLWYWVFFFITGFQFFFTFFGDGQIWHDWNEMKFKFDSSFRWNEGTRVLLEGPSSGPCHWSMARLSIEEALDMNIHSKQLRSLNSYQVTVDRPIPFVFLLFFFFCFWETRFCFVFCFSLNRTRFRADGLFLFTEFWEDLIGL